MSPAEIAWRLALAAKKATWRRRFNRGSLPAPPAPREHPPTPPWEWTSTRAVQESSALIAEANLALNHEWRFLGLSGVREPRIDWRLDPESGVRAPSGFGFDTDHRDERRVGNIKLIWEKSRHHHFTVLAAAYALTRDERYSREIQEQWLDWIARNPYLDGVHWTHPLEHGIRLLSWVWTERLLRGSSQHPSLFGRESPVWAAIYHHQDFIAQTYARGSSANNHLIGEMAGLLAAASAWPVFEKSETWRALARRQLEAAAAIQTFPSGLNREQAFGYHVFTLEFFVAAAWEARQTGDPMPPAFLDRLRSIVEAAADLADSAGNLPRYGDDDEGLALQIRPRSAPRDQWLLQVGRALTRADVPIAPGGSLAAALMGCECGPRTTESTRADGSQAWTDAGIYVLAVRRHTPREIFVLADAGPHGFLSIAAHAHADALAFTLSVGGVPILVDAGTYVYHTQPLWRDRFRGTGLHNTLRIDGIDQSHPAGAFLWSQQATTHATEWTPSPHGGRLTARHDGYKPLGVIHQRTFDLQDHRLTLTDSLQGQRSHLVELRFLCHPECHLDPIGPNQVLIQRGSVIIRLTLPGIFAIHPARGEGDAGWYSPQFGVRVPTWQVVARAECKLPVQVESVLEIRPTPAAEEVG